MSLLPLLLLGTVPSSPAIAQAPVAATLSADAETRWVPFDLTPGNQIRFQMMLDGRPVTAVLDTGVSYSVLARQFAVAQHLPLTTGGEATAIGGAVKVDWADTDRITLGGLTRTGGGITVADLPALATASATAVDMLVGRDLVGGYAVDIDYQAHRFRLLPSGRMPFKGATAPLSLSPDRLVYVSEVTLGGRRFRPMVVDTGDGSQMTVTAAGWKAASLPSLRTTTAISFGLAGPLVAELAVVPIVSTGDLVARNVEVRIEPAAGFSETIGVAGRIGSGFLQHYRVLLDPKAGRMVLSPGPDANQPPLRSTSGLLVGLVDGKKLRVLHVMRGSPAAAAGWQNGDEICSIDGTPVSADYPTNPIAGWSAGKPGRTVRLGLCNGPERTLTLATFY